MMEIVVMLLLVGVVGVMILSPLVKRSEEAWPADDAGGRTRGVPLRLPPGAPGDAGAAGSNAEDVLADLEFDHATGKLADDDYEFLRARIRTTDSAASVPSARRAPDEVIEGLEVEIRAARLRRRFCTACGTVLPKTARFCPACGTAAGGRA